LGDLFNKLGPVIGADGIRKLELSNWITKVWILHGGNDSRAG
jgi:hypothetical protein